MIVLNKKMILEQRPFLGTLCCESATWYWDLTGYLGTPITMYSTYDGSVQSKYLATQYKELAERKNIIKINNGITVTSKEQTICDLVTYEYPIDFIEESLENYLVQETNFSKLFSVAEENNCSDKLNKHIIDWEDYVNKKFNFRTK